MEHFSIAVFDYQLEHISFDHKQLHLIPYNIL